MVVSLFMLLSFSGMYGQFGPPAIFLFTRKVVFLHQDLEFSSIKCTRRIESTPSQAIHDSPSPINSMLRANQKTIVENGRLLL